MSSSAGASETTDAVARGDGGVVVCGAVRPVLRAVRHQRHENVPPPPPTQSSLPVVHPLWAALPLVHCVASPHIHSYNHQQQLQS